MPLWVKNSITAFCLHHNCGLHFTFSFMTRRFESSWSCSWRAVTVMNPWLRSLVRSHTTRWQRSWQLQKIELLRAQPKTLEDARSRCDSLAFQMRFEIPNRDQTADGNVTIINCSRIATADGDVTITNCSRIAVKLRSNRDVWMML